MPVNLDQVRAEMGPNYLFCVERSVDTEIVVYKVCRHKNVLISPLVDLFWTKSDDLQYREAVGVLAQEKFFGVKVRKDANKAGRYQMLVASMPLKLIDLQLKKNGTCSATGLINGQPASLTRVYVEMSKTKIGIPIVHNLFIHGKDKKTQQPLVEQIVITDEMRRKFDITNSIMPF